MSALLKNADTGRDIGSDRLAYRPFYLRDEQVLIGSGTFRGCGKLLALMTFLLVSGSCRASQEPKCSNISVFNQEQGSPVEQEVALRIAFLAGMISKYALGGTKDPCRLSLAVRLDPAAIGNYIVSYSLSDARGAQIAAGATDSKSGSEGDLAHTALEVLDLSHRAANGGPMDAFNTKSTEAGMERACAFSTPKARATDALRAFLAPIPVNEPLLYQWRSNGMEGPGRCDSVCSEIQATLGRDLYKLVPEHFLLMAEIRELNPNYAGPVSQDRIQSIRLRGVTEPGAYPILEDKFGPMLPLDAARASLPRMRLDRISLSPTNINKSGAIVTLWRMELAPIQSKATVIFGARLETRSSIFTDDRRAIECAGGWAYPHQIFASLRGSRGV